MCFAKFESKKKNKPKRPIKSKKPHISITIIKKPGNRKPGKKPGCHKPPKKPHRKTTRKPAQKPEPPYKPPYYIEDNYIRYYLDTNLKTELSDNIEYIFKRIVSSKTCLIMTKQTSMFEKKDIDIGYCSFNNVELSTNRGKPTKVCLRNDVTINELFFYIGYALGLVPEITRKDSSLNVKVSKQYISKSYYDKYYKVKDYNSRIIANSSFDFYSMMLSSPYFGSKKKGKKTYKFTSHLSYYYEKSINLTKKFNFNDIKRIWYLYCLSEEYLESNPCRNGGFFRNDIFKCVCPSPFTGRYCEEMEEIRSSCGDVLKFNANSSKVFYTIENVDGYCYYSIKSKNGKKVQFIINKLIFTECNGGSGANGVTVKYREDKGAEGLFVPGNYANIIFPPLSSEVYLIYYGDGSNRLDFSIQEVGK
uniref:EGF-like domain-containing protein n=1 Tax=Strongyloides papillosus TaxID=174720 RepID=A0A0N5BAR4_STREA